MGGVQPDVYTPEEWQQILTFYRQRYHQNPNDQKAEQAMKDAIAALNAFDQAEAPTGDRSVLGAVGGVARGALDIPEAMYNLVRHPIKTLGQATGIANIPNAVAAFKDPEANWAERLDALVRSTPANIGYAPQRNLMEVMSDPSTSSFERARGATNVASLALLGVKRAPPTARPYAGLPRAPIAGAEAAMETATRSTKPPTISPPAAAPRAPLPEPPAPLGAEQFGGPPVRTAPPGPPMPPRPPMPEPPTLGLETAFESAMRDPTFTPPASGITPKLPVLEPIPGSGGRGFYAEGPPTKPVTPAMEAFGEVRTGIPRPPRPQGSGGTTQKALTFGEESPLSQAARGEVKNLVGEISRGANKPKPAPGSAAELAEGLGKGTTLGGGFLGFSVGPFLAWEIMRRTIRPGIDAALKNLHPGVVMDAIRNSPRLQALESALIKAYAAGQTEHAQQVAQQLAQELLMQIPPQEQ